MASAPVDLFTPIRVGAIECANRVFMAPLTRMRANNDECAPTELHALYYAQRASAGLLISEGVQVCPQGKGYIGTPGMYSEAQESGWRAVTAAVHALGGKIVAQLWHVGPISHPLAQPDGGLPVAASAVLVPGHFYTASGEQHDYVTPRALTTAEVYGAIESFRHAAEVAQRAGFDGVEIHGAHNYLVENFIRDSTNKRTDEFGGSIENRIRFALGVVDAAVSVFGADRVGIRLSPVSDANRAQLDSTTQETYGALIDALSARGLAFLHLVEGQTGRGRNLEGFDFDDAKRRFSGVVMFNNLYTRQSAIEAVASGRAPAVVFGRPFISNPDLVDRLRRDLPLTPPDTKTFYAYTAVGYTDYPNADGVVPNPLAAAGPASRL